MFQCGSCKECQSAFPDHWLTDFWRFCPHRRVMSRRRARNERWDLVRGISPQSAEKHLQAATARMVEYMRSRGIDPEAADSLLQWYRSRDPQGTVNGGGGP